MEIFDIVDENGIPTGETIQRTVAHDKGIRHRTAHIWIVRNTDNGCEVLLQQRSYNKDSFPGRYDTSSAGHIRAGDEPLDSALRELGEELGIKAEPAALTYIGKFPIQYEREFFGKPFRDCEVAFVYLYTEPVDINALTLQADEVESVKWFAIDEVYKACVNHSPEFCVPVDGLNLVRRYMARGNVDNIYNSLRKESKVVQTKKQY